MPSLSRPCSDGIVRLLKVDSMSCALRSRESKASRFDSESSVGDIVAERGTTRVVTWRLGDIGDLGGEIDKGSGVGFRARKCSLPTVPGIFCSEGGACRGARKAGNLAERLVLSPLAGYERTCP
jgi:hypothetical protein